MEELTNNILEYQVYGQLALFADPITMVSDEAFSYQVPTYGALQGITESIYWKPTISWQPLDVRIMKQIRMNAVGKRMPKYFIQGQELNYHVYLYDVLYQVRVKMNWSNDLAYLKDRNVKKHMESAKRWLGRGGKKPVFLGRNECTAYVEPCEFGSGTGYYDNIDISFGIMVHGFGYPNMAKTKEDEGKLIVRMFQCEMEKGVIHFPAPEECTIKRKIRDEKPIWIPIKYENEVGK